MLAETASSTPRIRFKKGDYLCGEDKVPIGHEYRAYPFDALRGFVRWQDDVIVDQRLGRIADRFDLEREDLPADEDWQPQRVLPLEDVETGEVFAFVSSTFGGKKAIEALINATARAIKRGHGEETPLIRLAVGKFTSKEYGEILRPKFEIVNEPQEVKKTVEEEPSDQVPY
jgi:hypothetical protein